jgi:hypothetical protein
VRLRRGVGLLVAFVSLAACGGGRGQQAARERTSERGNVQGFDRLYPNESGTFAFRWIDPQGGQAPVETHVLEVVRLADDEVAFRDAERFRARDLNLAAWSSTPDVLVAYSGDVGTATIGPSDTHGGWAVLDRDACLGPKQVAALDGAVADRLPRC